MDDGRRDLMSLLRDRAPEEVILEALVEDESQIPGGRGLRSGAAGGTSGRPAPGKLD